MTITATFSTMLTQYLPDKLFTEELLKRDWLLQNIEHKTDWKGGRHLVPFLAAGASSISFGSLPASNNISEFNYVLGYEDTQVEAFGALLFNQKDLQSHDGKIPESTFIRLIPDQIDRFMETFKETNSTQMLCGPHFAKVTDSTNAASGLMVVDRIERFQIGQEFLLDDDDTSSAATCYVTAIDVNTSTITISASRGGAAYNASSYTAAQNAKCYHMGTHTGTATANTYNSVRSTLLSLTNGGSTTIHNQTKTSYPALQAYNASGAAITASNILEKLFDHYVNTRRICKGNASKILMSYKHLGSVFKSLEVQKGGYKVTKDPKASMYGWTEISIADLATGNNLEVVACQEMSDEEIFFLDMKSFYLASNGGIRKRKSPDGKEYYETRNTTGFTYIVDMSLASNLIWKNPGHNSVLHTISY